MFINKEKWLASGDLLEPGYFNFKKHDSIKILNNWSISLPKYLRMKFTLLKFDGDLFKVGSHTQKATELFRSYGVNKSLREVCQFLN